MSGAGILPTVAECRRICFEVGSLHPCAVLLEWMDHGKIGPSGPCLDPSPPRYAPGTFPEVRTFQNREGASFLYSVPQYSVEVESIVEVVVHHCGLEQRRRWIRCIVLAHDGTTVEQLLHPSRRNSSIQSVKLPLSLLHRQGFAGRERLAAGSHYYPCPELWQSCQDHGKIGQQGVAAINAGTMGKWCDSRRSRQNAFIESGTE